MSSHYINEFLMMKCSSDILGILNPIKNSHKEISESMSIVKKLRKIFLKDPDKQFTLFDLCAGNALTGVICAFLFKNVEVIAVDSFKRDRKWELIDNFEFIECDVNDSKLLKRVKESENPVIIGVHACKDLALSIIRIYNSVSFVKPANLLLMPCCTGESLGRYEFLRGKISRYMIWVMELRDRCNSKYSNVYIDKNNLSPKNAIILAR